MTDEPRKAWNSRGLKRPSYRVIRSSPEYKRWRDAVLYRDGYKCQKLMACGMPVIAHHINSFKEHPELQLDVNNGITLSVEVHKEFHDKYGKKNNTAEQLNEFLGKK